MAHQQLQSFWAHMHEYILDRKKVKWKTVRSLDNIEIICPLQSFTFYGMQWSVYIIYKSQEKLCQKLIYSCFSLQ